jgi:hypothetical protein
MCFADRATDDDKKVSILALDLLLAPGSSEITTSLGLAGQTHISSAVSSQLKRIDWRNPNGELEAGDFTFQRASGGSGTRSCCC